MTALADWYRKQFQFTHPGGVRLAGSSPVTYTIIVSIHAPGRGATLRRSPMSREASRFNSRTREGCDATDNGDLTLTCVSIHAPGRGATRDGRADCQLHQFQFTHPGGVRPRRVRRRSFSIAFQFTHPGGVRLRRKVPIVGDCEFQFTHPGGVRLQGVRRALVCPRVSIHAPGRGATSAIGLPASLSRFQFTHPGGVRLAGAVEDSEVATWFQFTHPGGVRPQG